MVAIRIYVEGGGDQRATLARCREGFSTLLGKVVGDGRRPKVVACGRRSTAYDRFCTAIRQHPDALCLLLVDSEGPVGEEGKVWGHLMTTDQWTRPEGIGDECAHLMVECMEAWLLADRACLARFYGQGFHPSALPGREKVEEIPKVDVLQGIEAATRHTKRKGTYEKVRHGFRLLAMIDPEMVREAAPHAARLFGFLVEQAGGES